LAQTARLGNAIFVSALVAVGGVALSAAWERRFRVAGVVAAALVAIYLGSLVAPRGHDTEPLRIAVVQGGGPQRTRAANTDPREVFERHLDASHLIQKPVDLVVWPENVVSVDATLPGTYEDERLSALARELGAPLIVGVTEGYDAEHFLNAAIVYLPDGSMGERFDKVRRVPFGEWVPMRSFIEKVAGDSGIPSRDAVPGTTPAVVTTPAGKVGVVISWEVFFTDRAADAIDHGGVVLLNPTNGSSYWLTQVQSQQIASSRLRAIETGRWEAQAAPTGFSAIVDPNGTVIDCTKINDNGAVEGWCRTNVSEQMVLQATIHKREGRTLALEIGQWPVLVLALAALTVGWLIQRRSATPPPSA
jgi:apolipoprotein N-acyltransferase